MKLLLEGGRVVDPASGTDEPLDLLIEEGRIARLGRRLGGAGVERLELQGLTICPGFLDMHVHLREPGQEWKETIESGTRAAAAGGFTGVACMPNTVPVNDNRAVTELILRQARECGSVAVYPIGCVTKGQAGEELAEMQDMLEAGARAFSDDGRPIVSGLILRKALEYSRIFDVAVIDHCEDPVLVDGGVMHEGELSTRLGLRGWPGVAEDVMVQRDILLAEYTGGHVHIAHLSTARAAQFVREAKQRGVRVSCEATPHHLLLTHAAVGDYDTAAKMNPPLRSAEDAQALIAALADGTIDAIATDHAPHHRDEKCVEFSCAPFGIVGLETAVSLCLDRLVRSGAIGLSRMVELFTVGPARILRLDRGRIAVGAEADLTVLDLEREVTVDPRRFRSLAANTPFAGWKLRGAPVLTLVGGRVVHDARGRD
ncbi:MAG TPA: dihydroorotase [Candidatus Polarisedimenticolaceae bacterium]|nr:dihydroorotase [Candidatus Polarisedimenticolaceae bacterium]